MKIVLYKLKSCCGFQQMIRHELKDDEVFSQLANYLENNWYVVNSDVEIHNPIRHFSKGVSELLR